MSKAIRILSRGAVACAALLAGACGDDGGSEKTTPSGNLEVAVRPLVQTSAVGDAVWDLEAIDGTGAPLWQKRLLSSQYGDARGGFRYTASCDPAKNPTTVNLTLVGTYAAAVDPSVAGAFGSSAASVGATAFEGPSPRVTRSFECPENADLYLPFDVAQVVPSEIADLGFFDRAAAVSGVACSVGVQCCAEDDAGAACSPFLFLPDETGTRGPSVLLKATCEKLDGTPIPDLMMEPLVVSCADDGSADLTLSPALGGTGACTAGDVAGCAAATVREGFEADDVVYQYLAMSDAAAGDGRFSVNQALGLREGSANCRLKTRFAVDDRANAADGASEGTVAAGVLYPVIAVDFALGGCGNVALDHTDATAPVHVDYLFEGSADTVFPLHVVDGVVTPYE